MESAAPGLARALRLPGGRLFLGTFVALAALTLPTRTPLFLMAYVALAATVALAWRARQGGPAARAFGLLAVTLGIQCVSSVVLQLGRMGVPMAAYGAPFLLWAKLATLVPQLAALALWPAPRGHALLRWRQALDALVFTFSLAFALWLLGLGEVMETAGFGGLEKARMWAYFMGYLMLLGALVFRAVDERRALRGPLAWLGIAFAWALTWNLVWAVLTLKGVFPLKNAGMDLVALPAVAAYLACALTPLPGPAEDSGRSRRISILMLPYLPMLLILPGLVHFLDLRGRGELVPQLGPPLALAGCALAALVLRQVTALWDLHRFSDRLAERVAERTRALEESRRRFQSALHVTQMATLGASVIADLGLQLREIEGLAGLMAAAQAHGRTPDPADLHALRRVAARAQGLVQALARAGQGGPGGVFDLRAHLLASAPALERLVPSELALRWDLGLEALPMVGDPARIGTLLTGLVSTGAAAGVLSLHCGRDEAGAIRLTVTGSGAPVDPDRLAAIGRLANDAGGRLAALSGPGHGLAVVFPAADLG